MKFLKLSNFAVNIKHIQYVSKTSPTSYKIVMNGVYSHMEEAEIPWRTNHVLMPTHIIVHRDAEDNDHQIVTEWLAKLESA